MVPGLILTRGTGQSYSWVSPPDSADESVTLKLAQAPPVMAVAGVKPTGLCSPCIRVCVGGKDQLNLKDLVGFFFSVCVGFFWLTLGNEALYKLLRRARTAASASILPCTDTLWVLEDPFIRKEQYGAGQGPAELDGEQGGT